MNAYSRIEVNLLPPEMQPGPMVRYSFLINVAISLLTLTFILLNLYLGWVKLDLAREDVEQLDEQVRSNAYIEDDYNRLAIMGDKLSRYGRLVAYASLDYVEMPVLLNRLAKIIPDGVYLSNVSNDRAADKSVTMIIQLKSSSDDPELIVQTLKNFKADGIFTECYLPEAIFQEEALDELLIQAGINWSVGGPGISSNVIANQYDFEIRARLPRPFTGLNLPPRVDDLPYFSSLGLESSTALPPADSQTPEGVTVEEVQ